MDEITTADKVEAVLSLIVTALAVGSTVWTTIRRQHRGSARAFLLLGALAVATFLHISAVIVSGQWYVFVLTPFALGTLLLLGELHVAARRNRRSRWETWIERRIERRLGIPAVQSLDSVRVEYAQTILDDAKQDPVLNAILDMNVDMILKTLSQGGRKQPTVDDVTRLANGWLSNLSEPQHTPTRPMYRRYSTDMLVLAAACRTAERL